MSKDTQQEFISPTLIIVLVVLGVSCLVVLPAGGIILMMLSLQAHDVVVADPAPPVIAVGEERVPADNDKGPPDAAPAKPEEKTPVDRLVPAKFAMGQVGQFRDGDQYTPLTVIEILGDDKMIVQLGQAGTTFILEGFPTAKLAPGQETEIKGRWRVAATFRMGERTLFIVRPAKMEKEE